MSHDEELEPFSDAGRGGPLARRIQGHGSGCWSRISFDGSEVQFRDMNMEELLLLERLQETKVVADKCKLLKEMSQDLALMVIEADEQLKQISLNIENSHVCVETATEDLMKASQIQDKVNKMRRLIFMVRFFLVMAAIGLFLFYAFKDNNTMVLIFAIGLLLVGAALNAYACGVCKCL